MLDQSHVATRLPVQDLSRARRFYAERLGLEPIEERPGGLRYCCGTGFFALFQSAGTAAGTHTQMGWEVTDIVATVALLRRLHHRSDHHVEQLVRVGEKGDGSCRSIYRASATRPRAGPD
jgi:catechol 2,3-dioxygenase-like lactoylglutathione lyase family enzyme